MRQMITRAGTFLRRSAGTMLLSGLAGLSAAGPGMSQNVIWEDFGGSERVHPFALTMGVDRYRNLTGDPLSALKSHSADPSHVIRSGTSSNINYTIASQTLCNTDADGSGSPNGPSCLIGAMGRVMWARVQFPTAGYYTFSLNHDDQVDIDISGSYLSNSYKTVSYNLPVGGLPNYSQETTRSSLPGTIYAPVNNSCGWVRIYWNNVGGKNHLGLHWSNPNGGPSNPGSTAQIIPAARFLPVNVTPGPTVCAASVTSAATAIQLSKELGSNGRARPTDQFDIRITDVSNNSVLATAGSGGSSTGIVADTGGVIVQSGRTYRLSETMRAGSISDLSRYNPQMSCTRNGVSFTPTSVSPGVWTVSVTQANQQFVCTILNQRDLVPPLAADDVISGQAVGTVVTFSPFSNDTDRGGSGLNNGSIILLTNGQPAGSSVTADGKRLTVPGQGVWQVTSDGRTVFTPASGFAGDPTPARYQIRDNDALISNIATLNVTYSARSDLQMEKSASAANPLFGSQVTFTLTVRNNGLSEATNVRVTDQLAAGYTWVSDDSGGSYNPATGLWTVGTLANGASRTLRIVVQVNPTGPYGNTAVATGDQTDPIPGNNTSTTTTVPVPPVADIEIEKTASDLAPLVGSEVTFTLTVTNNGTSPATNVRVTDQLPTGYTWLSDTSGGSYLPATGVWTVGSLAVDESRVLTMTARVNATGPYVNTASATASQIDPDPSNNTVDVTPVPVPAADLVMAKTVDNATPRVGDVVRFTLTVTNAGPSTATSVAVEDRLPAGYIWVADSGAGAYLPASGRWSIGTLANGASRSLTIDARVAPNGPWLNTAVARLTETDPVPANNTATATVTPEAVSDLAITKTIDNSLPIVGDQVVFTLTARNSGPSNATGVTVTDLLPAGYTFVSASPAADYSATTGLWTIGALNSGSQAQLQITASVTADGPWLNTATIRGDQFDPDTGNNTDSVTPGPLPRADVYVTKTASTLTPLAGGQVVFTLTAGNNGLSAATGVEVTDLMPSGLTLISTSNDPAFNRSTGVWSVGTLAAGATRSITLTARVEPSGDYTNTATITSQVPDPRPDNNRDEVTLVPVAQTDLSIVKSVSADSPPVGSEVTFTLRVENDGPSTATGVSVTDLLPSGYTYLSHTGVGTYTPATGLWTLGAVPPGTPRELRLRVRVNPTGDRLNTATVSGAEPDTDPSNNSDDATTTPVAQADLVMRKTVSTLTPNVGSEVTFTLRVTNAGPSAASAVSAVDLLPAGYTYVSHSPAGAVYTPTNGVWLIGALPSGESVGLEIVARVNASGPYANTATVSGPEADPDPGNNTGTVTPTPVPQADLRVTKSVDNAAPLVGNTVVFTLTAENAGPSQASNVSVSDLLPAGYSYVSHTTSAGTYSGSGGLWEIGTLAAAQSRTLEITARVNPTGPYENRATITGTEADPLPGNNTDTETVTPGTQADLRIAKVASTQTPLVGSTMSFTLTVTNDGPSPATSVTVAEALPSGYTYVGDNSGGAYNRNTGIWTVGTLASGASRVLTIQVRVNATGDYANVATVSSPVNDPDPSDNTDTETPVPQPLSDLSVEKIVSVSQPMVGDEVVFTLTARNNGPSNATGVQITDQLPAGYSFVSATGGSYSGDVWSVGSLAVGQSATLAIRARVLNTGPYRNVATISGDQTDPDPSNNTSAVAPGPQTNSDLRLRKTVDLLTPVVGSDVRFRLELTNLGPSDDTQVQVVDLLPDGFTFRSATGPGTYTPATGIWQVGNLANGASVTLEILAQVNATGNYTNSATASGAEPDRNPANNTDSVTLTPVPQADLAITKLSSNMAPEVGSEVTFTLTLTNNGPSEATQITVRDVLAAGYTYLSHAGPGSYTPADGLWSVGRLASGSPAVLEITARVNPNGPYSNTAVATGREPDPNPGNNSSTITPEPVPVADLAIVKTASTLTPDVGATITFTLNVTNNGPSAARNVQVTDLLPAGYAFVSAAGPGSYRSTDGVWLVGALPSGASRALTLTARVLADGPWTNTASVSGDERDPEPSNDRSSVTPGPVPQADLVVAKTVDNATPLVGSDVVFRVNVTNNGPSAATSVEITEALPAGYTYRSHTGPGSYSPGSGIWAPGNIASGGSVTLELTATVNPTGPWANTASATAAENDPIPENNRDTVTPAPRAVADLVMAKAVSTQTPNVGDVVTFTLTVSNSGPSTASDVRVTEQLPAGYSYVSDNGSGGYNPATGLWTVGVLAAGDSAELELLARVNASGSYRNTATATSPEEDPVPRDNTAVVIPEPVPQADVSVVKTASTLTPDVGGLVTFTLSVGNAGPSPATGTVLRDLLPAGYTWVSDNSAGAYNRATGEWAIGTLPAAATRQLSITARVNANGPWLNTARISAVETDPVPGNNQDSVTPDPVAQADLEVLKAVNTTAPSVGDSITFTLTARNKGPSAATSVRVSDPLPDGYSFISASGTGSYNPLTGIWTPGNLALNGEARLTITARVGPTGTYLNTASITGAEADPDLSNNIATVSPGPIASADVYVRKVVSNATPRVGDTVRFTLTAGNNGASDATGVQVTDLLPTGYSYVANSATETYDAVTGLWTIGNLPAGQTRVLEFDAVVLVSGNFTNSAQIRANEADPDYSNNTDSESTTPSPVTDLAVTKVVDIASPPVGGTVVFTLNARNNGPSTATRVQVLDLLPAGYRYLSHSGPGSYDPLSGEWEIGTLANGATAQLALTAQVNASGPWLNTATISGAEYDEDSTNNTASVPTTPVDQSDLAIVKTVSNAAPAVGSDVTFTLALTNNGPSAATGVRVTDNLPSGYSFVSATTPVGTFASGIWTVGTLPNGGRAELQIVARVLATGAYANTATVTGNENDPVPGNNTSTSTPVPSPRTDLGVTKTASSLTPAVGTTVEFTLVATNYGLSDATGVVVRDPLPAGYRFVSAGAGYNAATGEWSIGALPATESRTLTIRAEVRPTGPWANTARISGNETDDVPGNNTSTSTPVPVPVADVSVVKSVSDMAPAVGSEITFRLAVTNAGPSDATNVVVTDMLPGGYTWLSDNSAGSYVPSSGVWTVGSIPSGGERVLSLRVRVNPTGPYANTASVTATQTDPNTGNNTSTVTPVPDPQADLVMSKSVNNQTPDMGTDITFTLGVQNLGPSAATSVRVSDPLAGGYVYISDTSGGAYNPGTGIWDVGSLASGDSAGMTMTVRVVPGGPYVNTARVSAVQTDPRPGNNVATVSPGPTPRADLGIVKTFAPATPRVGETVTFTLTATNHGPSAANDVVVEDLLPPGYSFLSATSADYAAESGLWRIGALALNEQSSLTITARVEPRGDYQNTARISGREGDPVPGNNTSTVTPVPDASADLALVKTVNNPRPPVGSEVIFTLALSNNGPSEARGVITRDLLPNGYSYVSHSGPGSYNPLSGDWLLGTLGDGLTAELRITAQVRSEPGAIYRNVATTTSTTFDPVSGNNTDEVTPVPVFGGLVLEKTADVAELNAPGPVNYTIRVRNIGPTTVPRSELLLTDVLRRGSTQQTLIPVFTGGDTRGDNLLSPGETWTYAVTYMVNQAEFEAGLPLSNVVRATAPQIDGTPESPPAVTEIRVNPQIELEKTAALPARLVAGQTINWTVRVRNTGNITLEAPTPTDTLTTLAGDSRSLDTGLTFDTGASSGGATSSLLPVGAVQVWTGTSVLTQADVDGGGLLNRASVTATRPGTSETVSAEDSERVPVTAAPGVLLTKTVTPPATAAAGQTATWRIEVRNTGNVTLTAPAPLDVLTTYAGTVRGLTTGLTFDAAESRGGASATELPVGAMQVWTGTSVLTETDVGEGGLRNIATVTATPPSGAPLTSSGQADLPISRFAAISVEKTAAYSATATVGDAVTWSIAVRNTGNVALAAGVPTDILTGLDGTARTLTTGLTFNAAASSGGATETTLPVGAMQVWTGTSVLSQEDIDIGGLVNEARVVATPPGPLDPVEGSDRATAAIGARPAIQVTKTGVPLGGYAAGEIIRWTIRVENTGNVTLTTPVPSDILTATGGGPRTLSTPLRFDATASTGGATADAIPARGVQVWTADYVLIHADLDAGGLRNVAASTGRAPDGTTVTDQTTVDLPILGGPAMTLTKVAERPSELVAGEVITWVITLNNTGNVLLNSGVPTDVLTALDGSPRALSTALRFDAARSSGGATADRVPPAGVQVWTGTSVLTQADVDAGGLHNLASVIASPDNGSPDLTRSAEDQVPITGDPRLALSKAADVTVMTAPGPVGFTITVTNPGNISVAATDLRVTDRMETSQGPVDLPVTGPDPAGDLNGDGRLDPGETWIFRAVFDLTPELLAEAGSLRNVARAEVPGDPRDFDGVENDTPVVVDLTPPPANLILEKIAGVQTAMIGDAVPYTIRMTNSGGVNIDLRLTDYLPADFSLRAGSLRLDGVEVTSEGTPRQLRLASVRIGPGQTRVLSYQTVVGSSARPGNHTNRARVTDPLSGALLTGEVTATVKVVADAVFQCATVLGRVFDDLDQDGDMSRNGTERGLPNVRLVAPNGLSFTTDAHGRYNVPCAAMPRAVGSNFMLKLDPRSLPQDYRVTTENPRVVRVTPGMITRLDFGATRARMVRIDLAARAFGRDAAGRLTLSAELDRGLQALVEEISRTPTMVKITYVAAPEEGDAAIRAGLNLAQDRLRSLWHGRGNYKLNIETLIETGRAQR